MLLLLIMICDVDDPYANEDDGRHGNRSSNDASRADNADDNYNSGMYAA
jgi:hypothetical protein